MRITFLPLYEIEQPSSRYRVFQFLPALSRNGFECLVLGAPQRRPIRRLLYVPRLLPMAISSDLLFVQKRTLPNWLLLILRALNVKLIYDLDDAIYLQSNRRQSLNRMLQAAHVVIVGNENLAEYALRFNENVVVIPTVVDTAVYRPLDGPRHEGDSRVIIGWIGINPNRGDLAPLGPMFDWLSQRFQTNVVLRIVSDSPLQLETSLPVEFIHWALPTSKSALQQFDIGIMPLADTPWNRGKCGLKLIQYMAVGAASVASPVGANQQIIQDGRTGYLASTIDQWQTRLAELIEMETIRSALGRNAAAKIEQSYSINSVLPQLIHILHQAAV